MSSRFILVPAAALAVALSVAGCVTTGTEVHQAQLSQFHKGVTTEAQVEAALGKPQGSGLNSDGTTTLSYVYAHASPKAVDFVPIVGLFAGGATGEQTTVVFTFDKSGLLESYKASHAKTDVHTGL
jgi:outer membrane protein assembly factor BamE (lipoprotein component of BamABCDE complex)